MYGGSGADTLSGLTGDDLLVGETGNDSLNGAEGNDTYIFNVGDGVDTIYDHAGTDKVVFGEGISQEDIEITRGSDDLYLTNKKSGDRIVLEDFFYVEGRRIEEIEFADGSKWDIDYLKDKARYYYGTDGNDIISGYNSNQNAPTHEEEYLYGGAGNDYLQGGAGDDTYTFSVGDGQDSIYDDAGTDKVVFGEGINKEELVFEKQNNNLVVSVIGQKDTITINNYYYNDSYKVESFETADGSVLDYTKLDLMIQAMVSFEDSTGMMWEDAIAQNNEQANDIVDQWWTKE